MKKEYFELTNPQKSIWLIQQFYEDSTINTIAGYLRIHTACDMEKLEKAFNLVIKNNDGFRLRIALDENGPKQYLEEYKYEEIPVTKISSESEIENIENEFVREPFNVVGNKLYRLKLLELPNKEALLLLNMHHLISDAWTMYFFVNEGYKNYTELLAGKDFSEFEQNPSYIDFIGMQNEYLSSTTYNKDKEYWEEKFQSLPDYISFKTENNPGIVSNRIKYAIDEKTMKKIKELCANYRFSEFTFFLGIYTYYFRNIFNSTCYTIGNPVLNRSNYKQKHTMGMFVSTVPFVVNVNDQNTFLAHIQEITKQQLTMYRHIKYPYDKIFEYVKHKHNTNNKLFDIIFSYQNAKVDTEDNTKPITVKWFPNYNQVESLMVHMKEDETSGELAIFYDYLVDIIEPKQIEAMHNGILKILNQVLENIEIPLANLDVISDSEKNKLLVELNQTEEPYNKNSNLVEEFEKIVKTYPKKIAVSSKGEKLTYEELNRRANALARKICNTKIDTDIIAFEMTRGVNIIVAIWAILKSGHTYMPIDPEYPENRKKVMLDASGAKILITEEKISDSISFDGNKLIIGKEEEQENLNKVIPPNKKAYIMYTSGSTGVPKAVTIRHENVLNFVASMQKKLDYKPYAENKVLSVTTVCFDIFVFEHFATLLSGLELVIATELEAKTPKLLNDIIIKNGISKILTTPSRMQLLFLEDEYLECLQVLKEIILGGEPLPKQFLKELKKHTNARIYNLYGPTETTVYSTFKEQTNDEEITVGKPIANTQIYLLNDANRLVPYGAIGEIAIGGDGVGSGYYKNDEITNKVFIENPYKKGEIIYKTGDFGKWNEKGELICLGRKDYQVKIRGYRIELEDISNHMLTYPNIEKAVVIDRQDSNGKKYLCAYFVSSKKIDTIELKKYLTEKLPNYMVPTHLIELEELPLTINHKIDRKALPEPKEEIIKIEEIEPVTKTQKILCNVIKEELKLNKIGINHDLFDFQIDSLDIIRIQTKLLPYQFNLNTQDFYEYRTIEELAKKIDEDDVKANKFPEEELIDIQKCMNIKKENPAKREYKCILITGCTGYLGMQLLHDLTIKCPNTKIICLGRSKGAKTAKQRIEELSQFYFKEGINWSNVEIIDTDITKAGLGLSTEDYEKVCKEVDLVINCAANVRYYGEYAYFKKVNVDIVQNLIEFCMKEKILLAHVSTLGVSGNYLVSHKDEENKFEEDDFYIGQNYLENVYIHTKFEAEKKIYENVPKGLKAVILRVGNLTGRYSDGHFQKNIEENAFYHILLLIIKYGIIPEGMLSQNIEFTPVDLCSKAMIELLLHTNEAQRVYHIFNHNYINIKKLLEILKSNGYNVEVKTADEFNAEMMENIKKDTNILKGVVNDLDKKEGLAFISTIDQRNDKTNEYLKQFGFKWPDVSKEYIAKILNYIKENKILGEKI